ncbi:MAG: glutamate 5-kinase [Bdellovibrionales bacterium]|nr:glutamate 5-kinase [Bdellovibrionales bacterium]
MKSNTGFPQRVVIKLGTGLVVDDKFKFNAKLIKSVVKQILNLRKKNIEVVLVSSGAIGLAKSEIQYNLNLTLEQKQALAAIGQPLLMNHYTKLFSVHKVKVAQVLLTTNDLSERESYMNLRLVFDELLSQGVIPIVNENDCVSTKEIVAGQGKIFGDNDVLSALVASKLDASHLIILTDVAGVYNKNPYEYKDAKVISHITRLSDFPKIELGKKSKLGRGGMLTKVKAAQTASVCGVTTIIASGYEKNILVNTVCGEKIEGTIVTPLGRLQMRKKWLGFSKSASGLVVINDGARLALEEKHASLLPVGVVDVQGEFKSGDLICIMSQEQFEIARGLSKYSSSDLKKVLGMKNQDIKKINLSFSEELVHRDNLVVFKELYSI